MHKRIVQLEAPNGRIRINKPQEDLTGELVKTSLTSLKNIKIAISIQINFLILLPDKDNYIMMANMVK